MITKLLMFSGGLDSTILFHDLISHNIPFKCVFVDYGQKNQEQEWAVVKRICDRNLVDITKIVLPELFQGLSSPLLKGNHGEHTVQSDEIRNRNATLGCVVASNIEGEYTLLFGAHKTGAAYADATPRFYTRLSKLLHWSTNGRVDCEAPYIRLTKKQIVRRAWDLGMSRTEVWETVSCYNGNNCGFCPACKARREALKGTNFEKL